MVRRAGWVILLMVILSAAVASASETDVNKEPSQAAGTTHAPSKFRSSEDGWLDVSGFLDQAYGFVPVVMPVTEPAVGYGAAGGLVFIDKPVGEAADGFGRPNLTVVGGLATENGTWGVLAGDVRHWLDDRLQTLAGLIYASVNLDFYGIGRDDVLKDNPLTYNLEPLGGLVHVKYRLGGSRVSVGLGYAFATTKISFDAPPATPRLPDFRSESRVGGLTTSLIYDSRDTIFTPARGAYLEASAGLFSQALGGDDEFQRVNLTAMRFLALRPELVLGVRCDAVMSFGDVPFYLRPFIALRGAQLMRYQGDHVAQIEAELRWQLWKRFSLVGFAGAGLAWNDFKRVENTLDVVTGGMGFRYELARKYGLHMGVDVAFGPDAAIYVQFGSAWIRP